jgi:pSer/pThr/pTyr-binding forkhead associated (FHA) protein
MQLILRIVTGALAQTRLLFATGQYLFGRAPGAHVLFPPNSIASRRHCLLLVTDGGASVRDLGSSNGTMVNEKRISGEKKLAAGDLLTVGETTFRIELQPADVPEPDAEEPMPMEVSGKPLGETIDLPLARTMFETKLVIDP